MAWSGSGICSNYVQLCAKYMHMQHPQYTISVICTKREDQKIRNKKDNLQIIFWSTDDYSIKKQSPRGVLWKKVFLEISQNSQENTCARASFLIKLQTSGLVIVMVPDTLIQSYQHCIFSFFTVLNPNPRTAGNSPCWKQGSTLLWRRSLSCRHKSTDLLCKSMEYYLYVRSLRHERVNIVSFEKCIYFFSMKVDLKGHVKKNYLII